MKNPFARKKGSSGLFISFEGGEGSGKTTQSEMLKEYFLSRGIDAIITQEPGGTELGKRIRDILLDDEIDEITPIAEACLFAADRAQQVRLIIEPAIEKGWVVIGDRYVDSSLVYQGVARGCGLEAIKNLNDWATDELSPDLTIYLDIPVARGLDRIGSMDKDRIEKEAREFHENVRNAYKTLMKLSSGRVVEVDALGTPESVHHRVVQELERYTG